MKWKCVTLAAIVCGAWVCSVQAAETTLEHNKQLVMRFYNALIAGDKATLTEVMREDYKQHQPEAESGRAGLFKFIDKRPPLPAGSPPPPAPKFIRTVAEGDYVFLFVHFAAGQGRPERAAVDMFRIQDGKLAEHWAVIQPVPQPGEFLHPNGFF